jgi:hypothetical protein
VPFDVPAYTTLDPRLSAALEGGKTIVRLSLDNATNKNGVSSYSTLQVNPGTALTATA